MISTVGSLIFKWSGFFLASAMFTLLGFVVWWLIRKRFRDFWLPVVRVFTLQVSRLPRIIVQRPPWIPFLLFLLCALSFLVWSLAPSTKVLLESDPGIRRVHVFIDMSPSVSGQVSLSDLSKKISELLEQVSPKSRVSFGTSHGDNIYEMTSPNEAADVIAGLGFHRGGSKIGSGVRSQITRVGNVDQLFVVSDRDQHSWMGFQWQYLAVDAEVHHVDLDDLGRRVAKPNVFIQDARYLSSAGAQTMDWEVELSLGVLDLPVSGKLSALVGGDVMAKANWEIASGARRSLVNVSWPISNVVTELFDPSVEWLIEVDGGDLLAMDNTFRTPLKGRRDQVVLVGEPSGELRLEDPLVPLETALRVSGYAVSRYDRWPVSNHADSGAAVDTSGTIVMLSGESSDLELWCPRSLMNHSATSKVGNLWLTPRFLQGSFAPLCLCLANLGSRISSDMCDGQMSRGDWISLLRAVGGKQVGGDLGEASGSLAMMISSPDMPRRILSFTVPVRPIPEIGLNWGQFPIMIKDLMLFSQGKNVLGHQESQGVSGSWPRLADVSAANLVSEGMAEQWTQVFRSTNVPVGESLISVMPLSDLPSSWSSATSSNRDGIRSGRESEDSRLWVNILASLILCVLFFEILWLRLSSRVKVTSTLTIMILSWLILSPDSASAKARLDILGEADLGNATFRALSREVASRTSLELSLEPQRFSQFDDMASESPWLWTSRVGFLADKNGRLTDGGRLWLKRGGILIFDGPQPSGSVEKLMEPLLQGTVNPSGWMAMPADHEFMRSFYLLNSLPTCKGRSWRIFSFDGRVVAIEAPYSNLKLLQDRAAPWSCGNQVSYEQHVRIFVNLMMTAFTTDYKRDQIHLPEILKRLRVP